MSGAGNYFNRYMQSLSRSEGIEATVNEGIENANIWFHPIPEMHNQVKTNAIGMMQKTGAVWTFLSPKVAYELMSCFSDLGLKELMAEYFEEQPCVSFLKSTLRRVEPLERPADWHQDGAFMGSNIKSLNLWIALTECGTGTSSPGMEIVPKRLDEVLPGGTNGAAFDWSVSQKSVREWFKDCPPERPHFNEGDAIFFDHLNLHATAYDENFTLPRYAIETWFFAQSYNAKNQIPVLW